MTDIFKMNLVQKCQKVETVLKKQQTMRMNLINSPGSETGTKKNVNPKLSLDSQLVEQTLTLNQILLKLKMNFSIDLYRGKSRKLQKHMSMKTFKRYTLLLCNFPLISPTIVGYYYLLK